MSAVDVVHPLMGPDGWTFDASVPGATGDSLFGSRFLRDVYVRADPRATGRVTVPVLWDRETGTIVSNESADIVRMFNDAFDAIAGNADDYRPEALRPEIDAVNARVYPGVNDGVYRAGFATRRKPTTRRRERSSHAGLARRPARRAALRRGRPGHRSRLAARDHPVPLRHGLPRPFQVQPPPARRLPEPVELRARTLPVAGGRRDHELRSRRAALLREPPDAESVGNRPRGPGDRLERASRPLSGQPRAAARDP